MLLCVLSCNLLTVWRSTPGGHPLCVCVCVCVCVQPSLILVFIVSQPAPVKGPLSPQHARVWIPDRAEVWRPAAILRDYAPGDATLRLQLEDGTVSAALGSQASPCCHDGHVAMTHVCWYTLTEVV